MKSHTVSILLSVAAALFATTSTCHASPYDIDYDFGDTGKYNQSFPGSDFRTLAHLPRPDGTSIAIVTYDNNGCPAGRDCLAIIPFNAAGQAEGVTALPINLSFSKLTGLSVVNPPLVKAAAIDSLGRIVIVGTEQFASVFQFKVIRLLPNGVADTSFDGDGIALPGFFTVKNKDFAESVVIDASDRIVVAGRATFTSDDTDFAVLRLTTAGVLDTSFDVDGKKIIGFDLTATAFDGATAIDIGPGGTIYLAGYALDYDTSTYRIALAKLLPDGSYDSSFCPTSCSPHYPYAYFRNGRRVLYYGVAGDNLSDFVSSMAVNVSGEMVYAGLHATGEFTSKVFTQKVNLNGDFANEGLSNVGVPGKFLVGGIRYLNRNNSTSDLVLTGTVAASSEFFFAQGLNSALVPIANWASGGTDNSSMIYGAGNGTGDNPGNLPAIPSVDANARVLVGGSFRASAVDPNHSINVMRLKPIAPADLIFRNGFE